jgi:hypothetical protein
MASSIARLGRVTVSLRASIKLDIVPLSITARHADASARCDQGFAPSLPAFSLDWQVVEVIASTGVVFEAENADAQHNEGATRGPIEQSHAGITRKPALDVACQRYVKTMRHDRAARKRQCEYEKLLRH